MTEEAKTISLVEFADRAVQGREFTQELKSGEILSCRVHTPKQADAMAVRKIMLQITKIAETMKDKSDITAEQASLAYTIGLECLRACVRDESGAEIPDEGFVDLFSKLPYQSELMTKCQELCGCGMFIVPPFDNADVIKALKEEIRERTSKAAKPKKAKPKKAKG